ncbi:MAG: hypothetical protein ACXAEU_03600 [Candidatus Hodarchaeales archaeon]|jgi:hypothetical protein
MITENLLLSYISGSVAGLLLFLMTLLAAGWDFSTFLSQTSQTSLFSVITTKFLSGLGITMTYAMFSMIAFRLFSNLIKGKKRRLKIVKGVLVLLAIVIFLYGILVFVRAFFFSQPLTFQEMVMSLLGMWSLIFFVYILPVLQHQFQPYAQEGFSDIIKGSFSEFKHSIWKGYQSRVRKEYGKVQAAEYERYKDGIADIRAQLSGFLLFPFMLVWIVFPPVMGIAFVICLRLFTLNEKPFTSGERLLLLFLITGTLVTTSLLLLFVYAIETAAYLEVGYAVGIFISIIMLIKVIRDK